MNSPQSVPSASRSPAGFTLIELLVVLLIVSILLGVGVSMLGRSDPKLLASAADQLTASVEQARTSAITRRKPVALVLLEPGQAGFDDDTCRLGIFELAEGWGGGAAGGELIQRWRTLPTGVAFFGGAVDSLDNFRDAPSIALQWKKGSQSAEVRALVFTPRGGLAHPEGSESVVIRLGNGTYRGGEPVRTTNSGTRTIRVGRVVARAWSFDA